MRFSLRGRLFVLTAIAILPAIAILTVNELQLRNERTRQVREQAVLEVSEASQHLQQVLDGFRGVMATALASEDVSGPQTSTCSEFLARAASQVPGMRGLAYRDASGAIVCASAPSLENDRTLAVTREALAKRAFAIGRYAPTPDPGGAVLPLALAAAAGQNAGAISAEIDLEWLDKNLLARGVSAGGAFTVADGDGAIIAREPFRERFVGLSLPPEFMFALRADKIGVVDIVSRDGTPRVLAYAPYGAKPAGLYVGVGISKADAFGPINMASAVAGGLIALSAALAFFLAWFFGAFAIQKPVERMVKVAQAWGRGDHSLRAGLSQGDSEFQQVGSALDGMMAAIQADAEQKELANRELVHRMKNTLAIVSAIANQTVLKGAAPTAADAFLQRVSALSGAYDVLLSGAEEGAEIHDVLGKTLRPFATDESGRIQLNGPSVTLSSAAALSLVMLAHELATNATKYGALSRDEGHIAVEWQVVPADTTRVSLTWTELDGPHVSPPNSSGFGSRLIRRAFSGATAPKLSLDYAAEGLRCAVEFRYSD